MNDHVAQQELEQRNRLPTLMEVLGRRTLAPVDLFSFYIYMRDQQRSVDYLDFWLDVSQHMSLCRHYVRELRRSMLIDTPTLEKEISTRSSQMLDGYGLDDSSSHPSSIEKRSQEQKVSQILRSENSNGVKSRGLNMRTQNVPQLPVDYERSSANSMTSSFSQSGQGLRKVGTEGEYSEKSEHYHGQVITDSSPGQNRGTFHDAATRFTGQPPLITRSVSGDIDKVPVLAPAVPITHTDDTSTALGRGVVAVHGSPNVTTVTSGPMQTTTTTTTTTRVLPDGRTSTTTTTAYPINRNGSHSLTQPAVAYAVGNTVRPGPTTTGQNGTQYAGAPPRPSFMTLDHSSSRGPTGSNQQNSSSPGHTVSRPDLRASAEQILYTSILPGSEREIVLPQAMVDRMIYAIEEEGRDDPEVFDSAKEYVFQAMERDAFPGFLQAKALGNLVPLDILIRLIIGLLTLGAGFWAGYYFILRNKSRRVRCWVILPFTIGTYFLVSYQYKLDMFTAYAGLSEYTWMNWSKVREPYVRRLLIMRANAALLLWVLAAVILCIIFIFVPGTYF